MTKHKVIITSNQDNVNHLLDNGWMIVSVTSQRVAAGGGYDYSYSGKFCFVLKK